MSQQVGKFFAKALRASSSILETTEGRIYPVCIPSEREDVVPYLVWVNRGLSAISTKEGFVVDRSTVDVIVCSETYEGMLDLTEDVLSAIDSADTTDDDWNFEVISIEYSCGEEQYDDAKPCYFKTITFTVETQSV